MVMNISTEVYLENLNNQNRESEKFVSVQNAINQNPMDKNESTNRSLDTHKTLNRNLTFVKSSTLGDNENNCNSKQSKETITENIFFSEENVTHLVENSTQTVIEYKDEECETVTDNFDEIDKDTNYVLINRPVYILKAALSPDRRIVLPENEHVDIDIPVKDLSHLIYNSDSVVVENLNLSNYPILTQTISNLNCENNFHRLLHSDYDLTPQKEECPNKYHYLMTDAYTTISNPNITCPQSKEDLLIRSETYLNNNNNNEKLSQNLDKQYCLNKNDGVSYEANTISNLPTIKDTREDLLAASEEYLLHPLDLSIETSTNDLSSTENPSRNVDESKSNSFLPFDKLAPETAGHLASEVPATGVNLIDKYKIEMKNGKKSNSDHRLVELRRHKSLQ